MTDGWNPVASIIGTKHEFDGRTSRAPHFTRNTPINVGATPFRASNGRMPGYVHRITPIRRAPPSGFDYADQAKSLSPRALKGICSEWVIREIGVRQRMDEAPEAARDDHGMCLLTTSTEQLPVPRAAGDSE
jgi:hypothetical protein